MHFNTPLIARAGSYILVIVHNWLAFNYDFSLPLFADQENVYAHHKENKPPLESCQLEKRKRNA